MKVSVGQFHPAGVMDENIATMRRLAEDAKADGAGLVVFPEESMFTVGLVEGDFIAAVDDNWSRFVQQLSFVAREVQIAIVAGGYESSGEDRPYNTLVAVDDEGRILDTYRKLHLYDAFSYQESKKIKPGDNGIKTVNIGGLNVGIMTCYDIRFPELARAMADKGVDLIAVAAAWFKGDHKIEHWESLLKVRAIENTVWVAAAGTSSEHCIGHSVILDPMGVPHAYLNDEPEGLVTVDVTKRRIDEVREFLPVLKNRRLETSPTIVDSH
ncbi:MAG TPA: carbon-nitrogen hydrolase family protein [Arthrobacter sp.]|nr:carbon-nitrogen hydrolase family protein [Arthrobacter sp.]